VQFEAHEKIFHFEASPFGSSLECSFLLGHLVGFGLKMHVDHGLGLEHDLGLGVGPSYKPCWDRIILLQFSLNSSRLTILKETKPYFNPYFITTNAKKKNRTFPFQSNVEELHTTYIHTKDTKQQDFVDMRSQGGLLLEDLMKIE